MNALILAAGLGTRLKPLTDTMPKAMVPVNGKPLLEHTVSRLVEAGATEIVVNVHHFGQQIIDFLKDFECEVPIRISDERDMLLNTGGAVKRVIADELFSDKTKPILIHNVDIFSNADIPALYEESLKHDATLLVSPRETQRYLLFDDDMKLVGWTNKQTGEVKSPHPNLKPNECQCYAFSGIHCVSPSLEDEMKNWPDAFSIIDFYLSACHKKEIRGCLSTNLNLIDVGKMDTLAQAEKALGQ